MDFSPILVTREIALPFVVIADVSNLLLMILIKILLVININRIAVVVVIMTVL